MGTHPHTSGGQSEIGGGGCGVEGTDTQRESQLLKARDGTSGRSGRTEIDDMIQRASGWSRHGSWAVDPRLEGSSY